MNTEYPSINSLENRENISKIEKNKTVLADLYNLLISKKVIWGGIVGLILYFVSRINYLLFHCFIEGVSIVVAILLYVLASRTYKYSKNSLVLFLGIAHVFIVTLEFLHMLTYKGMGVFPGNGSNITTQLGIAASYMEAGSLCVAPLFDRRGFSRVLAQWVYAVITVFFISSIFWLKIFPGCFFENQGLTLFKVASEYIISMLILVGIIQLYFHWKKTPLTLYYYLMVAMGITILSELSFTLYADVYGIINFGGHLFKLISYYLVYRGIIMIGLENPFNSIFRKLKIRTAKISSQNEQLQQEIERRKQMEEISQHAYAELNQIFENGTDGMCVISIDFSVIRVNNVLSNLVGLSKEEILGKKCYEVFSTPRCRTSKCGLVNILQGKTKYEYDQEYNWNKDKSVYGMVTVKPFRKSNGELIGIVENLKDISERKFMEQEIARLDKVNLVGEMAVGIGHEIRNPITTVRGFLQMFSEKKEFSQNKEYIDLMLNELDQANLIITDFLALANNKALNKKTINLNNIITGLIPLIKSDAILDDKDVMVDLEIIPDLFLDEGEISQLILNISQNGLEAMTSGGNLIIRTYTEGENVVLAIQDQGGGIDPNIFDKLGIPFLTTKDNGVGLGMAVCYNVAARHNAKINVETSTNGTTFFIRINSNGNDKIKTLTLHKKNVEGLEAS